MACLSDEEGKRTNIRYDKLVPWYSSAKYNYWCGQAVTVVSNDIRETPPKMVG